LLSEERCRDFSAQVGGFVFAACEGSRLNAANGKKLFLVETEEGKVLAVLAELRIFLARREHQFFLWRSQNPDFFVLLRKPCLGSWALVVEHWACFWLGLELDAGPAVGAAAAAGDRASGLSL
jgi:hypothetical protein